MKYLKKFATVSQLNNWIYNNLSSYEEPNVYTIGDNEDNLEVQYNKDYTIITLNTSIQNSVTGNSEGSLWTIYNGDIYEEILLDDIKIDNPMTPLTYNDVSKGKHILKMKFKNNIIGSSAPVFYNSFVKKAKIAKNIINIGTNAFLYCNELDEIDFGNITSIGSSAFASCYKLTEIEIPDSVTNIGDNAFGGIPLRRVKVGKGITQITPQYYGINTYLEEFIMSDSVTQIVSNAFAGCTSLKSIVIPDSVTTISNNAFDGCTSLTSIDLPDSIHTIYNKAFYGCTSLKEFTIPKNAINVAGGILVNSGVKKLTIKSNTNIYVNSIREKADAIEELIFDNNVTTIGNGCCAGCTSLKNVILPNTVEIINDSAFSGCTSLTSITIPSSVIKLTRSAFNNCTSLESVNILGNTEISNGAFAGCTSLSSITFNSAVNLSSAAFTGCTSLTSISIPENSVLSSAAFNNCTSLSSISIPESVTSTYNYSIFTGCTSLGYVENGIRYVDINTSIGTEIICFEDTTLSSYTIKSGVKNISFNIPELPNATEFNISNTVTNFNGTAILDNVASILTSEQINALLAIDSNCISKSKKIELFSYIENGIKYYDDPSTGTEIVDFVDTTLTSYSIKSGVRSITKSIPVLPNAEEFIIPSTVTSYSFGVLNNIIDLFSGQELEDLFDANAISKDIILNNNLLNKSYLSQQYFSIYNSDNIDHYVKFKADGTPSGAKYFEYSKNGSTWDYIDSTNITSVRIQSHETIIIKSNIIPNTTYSTITAPSGLPCSSYYISSPTWPVYSGIGLISLDHESLIPYGNIMSLLKGDNFVNTTLTSKFSFAGLFECSAIENASNIILPSNATEDCYYYMFFGCTKLNKIPELPATTLAEGCYNSMFSGCTALTVAPELPATTLANFCYNNMFYGCTSLTTTPELPATTLADYCYYSMFNKCSSLTTAPELPVTTLANNCYNSMFSGCTALTVAPELPATTLKSQCYYMMFYGCTALTTAPELPATTLATYCYSNMFGGCTSLVSAPELPATTLDSYCYQLMFNDCTGLTTVPELPTTTLATYCYTGMFYGCTALTVAPELPATTLANYCYSNMFYGCTALTTAPELPATTLATNCYSNMFNGCTSLNYVKMLATNISASYCLNNWLKNVNSTGTFVKHIDATWSNSNVVPSGWTVENYEERPTPRELPEGYTEVKYIASTKTGGQYIDLNIKLYETLNTNYDIAIKFNIIGQGLNNSTNAPIFACQDPTGSPWPGTFIRRTASSNNVVGRYIGGTAKDNTIGQVNTIIELPVQTPPNKNVTNLSNSGKTHSYGTSLFCVFGDTNNTARDFTEAKLYYFKLFVEGTLVRDLVPCINSSNVAGLYDVVNDVFYTSPNGAAFIYEAWAS